MVKRISYLIAGLVITLLGCSGNKEAEQVKPGSNYDRKAMLINIADNIIIPGYGAFKTKFDLMKSRSENFLASPSTASLIEFRTSWKEAYIEWQKVEMFEIGPAEEVMLRTSMNIYPFNVSLAENNISTGSYNLEEAGQVATKGFPSIDYFLNGVGADDAAVVAWFADPAKGAARKKYVQDVISLMSGKLDLVVSRWNGAYRNEFLNNSGTDAASSTAKLVNAYVLHYERFVRSGKIGIPAGIMGSSLVNPSPEKVEAFYKKDLSRELALTSSQAILDLYRGKAYTSNSTGSSFKSYFSELGTKGADGRLTAEILDEQLVRAINKIQETNPSFYEQITTDRSKMVSIFEEIQLAVRFLKLDMTSAMGISISYTDNDGD